MSNDSGPFVFAEWSTSHQRFPEFSHFVEEVAPEQMPFARGEYDHGTPHVFVALENGEIAGAIRFVEQPIGPEAHCPVVCHRGRPLTEAKINVFAVRPESRGRGLGTQLQRRAIDRARELGCHQVASYSTYDKEANYHVKLSLVFAAQPELHPDNRGDTEYGVYFLLPLGGNR
jgi:GNAT superfamily N-acetyltransferase